MTPEPTTNEAPAQPEIATPVFNPDDGPAPTTPYSGQPENITPISVTVDGPSIDEAKAMAGPEPTPDELEAARKGLEDDMRDAVPFNRLAVHTGFQRAIQERVAGKKPETVRMLCAAFRDYAEAESLLQR